MAILRAHRQQLPAAAMALALCAAAGAMVALRAPAAPLVGLGGALGLATLRWRSAVVLLLVILPLAGVPVFMAGEAGLALRDVVIVAPLYVAFACWSAAQRGPLLPSMGVALPALIAFATLVVVHIALAPSLAVGALGAKVWLAYIPMVAIGYHFARTRDDVDRALRLTALLGLVPASIALAEWALAARHAQTGVWVNDFGPFRLLYGSWFEQVQGSGLALPIGDQRIVVPRVPSTFTSSTQFYAFSMVACAAGLSQALRSGQWRWIAGSALLATGVIASGERQAYLTMPLLVSASVVLAKPPATYLWTTAIIGATAVAAVHLVSPGPAVVLRALPGHARAEAATVERVARRSGHRAHRSGHGLGHAGGAALRRLRVAAIR